MQRTECREGEARDVMRNKLIRGRNEFPSTALNRTKSAQSTNLAVIGNIDNELPEHSLSASNSLIDSQVVSSCSSTCNDIRSVYTHGARKPASDSARGLSDVICEQSPKSLFLKAFSISPRIESYPIGNREEEDI